MQLARRFHNDAVTDVRRVRRKRVVRWFRLAGHAELPRTVEIDDELPPCLDTLGLSPVRIGDGAACHRLRPPDQRRPHVRRATAHDP